MKEWKKSDFYFDLPEALIAQDPLEDRSASRLLVLNKRTGEREHHFFHEITDYLEPGDCLVLNNTKVIPARLTGIRETTGAAVELLLLKRREKDVWETLVKPGKKARPGTVICFGDGLLKGEILEVVEEGNRLVRFTYQGIFEEVLDRLGEMPLPPYITHKLEDKNRYQTVYAKYEGSAAAPTAGLHFTGELLKKIEEKGVSIARRARHLPPGKGGKYIGTPYAFRILPCAGRGGGKNQPGQMRGEKSDLCGNHQLQDGGKRCGRERYVKGKQRRHRYFYLSRVSFQSNGRIDYQFSFTGIDAGYACFRVGGQGKCS